MANSKLYMVSLGCPKNRVDSEETLTALTAGGVTLVTEETDADIVLVNTCGFVTDAKAESIDTILELAEIKKTRPSTKLAVMGCLSERYRDDLIKQIPEIDHIFGVAELDDIVAKLAPDKTTHPDPDHSPRILTTARHWTYLKIAEGCSNTCSFCVIPKIRGPYISRPMNTIVAEAESLAERGVKEIILVAQDTSLYGADLKIKQGLTKLLHKLEKVNGMEWIRVLYLYPALLDNDLIKTIGQSEKVVPYFDIPLQHASDFVLKRMKRPETESSIRRLLSTIRELAPTAAIRTSLITGFPGETDDDFDKLHRLVKEVKFDHMGVFAYSPEEDTTAVGLPDQVDEAVANERLRILMETQNGISAKITAAKIGQAVTVMVDDADPVEMILPARLKTQAPGIDGCVILDEVEAEPGRIITVKITGANDYDLIGKTDA